MIPCYFVSDLHGIVDRYLRLFNEIQNRPPAAVFLGGDILPQARAFVNDNSTGPNFLEDFLFPRLFRLRACLLESYPRIFMILGNDDGLTEEDRILDGERQGLWTYANNAMAKFAGFDIYGYCFIPPSPFMLKDWERYDVSRHISPGAISPEEGYRSAPVPEYEARYTTIQGDLEELTEDADLYRAVFLFHAPPHETRLDRADTDGKLAEYVPLDTNVGSIAIRRLIEARQPHLTLHGHIHESPRLTGSWMDNIGRTVCISAAHDGPELALVRFDLENPSEAMRELL
jgi:Icc-related predicted phosphoesterase